MEETNADIYHPSKWSKRLPANEIVDYHRNFIDKESERVRREIQCELNIPYGSSGRQKIDIFGTDLPDDSPILVHVHGGYWQATDLNRFSYEFMAENLYENSIKSIFIGYDLCPEVTMDEIINQVTEAARFCLNYAKEKKSKGLHFCGHSAGGHLVVELFTNNNFITTLTKDEQILIKSVISIAGVFDLLPLVKTDINHPLKLTEEDAINWSPLRQQISNGVGTIFYLIAAENDSPWFIEQSKEFCKRVTDQGYCGHYWLVPDVDHFDIIERLSDIDFELTKYIIDIIILLTHCAF